VRALLAAHTNNQYLEKTLLKFEVDFGAICIRRWPNVQKGRKYPLQRARQTRKSGKIKSKSLLLLAVVCTLPKVSHADTTANWLSAASDNWTSTTAWSTTPTYPDNGTPTGQNYLANVAATGSAYTVTLNSNITLDGLTLNSANATIDQFSGTLTSPITLDAGTYTLEGGTIANSTVNESGGTFNLQYGTFNGVTVTGGDFQVGGTLTVQNGITIANHNLDLGPLSSVYFDGPSQTINNLNINAPFNTGANIYVSGPDSTGPQTLTLGANATIDGPAQFLNDHAGDTLINNGTINSDSSSSYPADIATTNFTNNDTVEATNGASLSINSPNWVNAAGAVLKATGGATSSTLSLYGTWSNPVGDTISINDSTLNTEGTWTNNGVISVTNNSTVHLGGSFNTASLAGYQTDATTTTILTGTLTNTMLNLANFPGAWYLEIGTINGGTVVQNASQSLIVGNGAGTLNGVSITGGDLQVTGTLTVQNGITIANHNLDLASDGKVYFDGPSQTINNLNINTSNYAYIYPSGPDSNGPQTLTLGANVTLDGPASIANDHVGDTLINNGTINSNNTIYGAGIATTNFTNNATTEATGGGTLSIEATNWSNTSTGILSATGASTLNLSGSWSNAGSINITGGSMLNLNGSLTTADLGTVSLSSNSTGNVNGSLNNTSATFTPSTYGGQWTLSSGGTITNGTLNLTGNNFTVKSGILNGVSVTGGDLNVAANGSLDVQNGLTTIGHNLNLGNNSELYFDGSSQTINNLNINIPSSSYAYINAGGPNSTGAQTLTLGANVTVDGQGQFMNYGYYDNTLINNGTINANIPEGTLSFQTTNFTNNGIVEASNGAFLTWDQTNFTNNGTIALNGGTIYSPTPGQIAIGEGTLTGSGTINGNVALDADPSTLAFHIGGETQGALYDSITIEGSIALAGNLELTLTNGFVPLSSDTFAVLDLLAGHNFTITGSFADVANGGRLETTDGGGSFQVDYGGTGQFADEILLSNFQPTVPEPASFTLLATAGGFVMSRRRRPIITHPSKSH
jgi:fibronectin-binding autotransporter adhesin